MQIIQLTKEVSLHVSDKMSYEDELLVEKIVAMAPKSKNGITLQLVADCTCKYFHFTLEEIQKKSNTKKYAIARQCICILYLDYKLDYSMQEVANFLGRKSHAIVFNAERISSNNKMQHYVSEIKLLIQESIQQSDVNIIS